MEGFSKACRANGVALIGGETAQMPGIYPKAGFDIVGFIVGKACSDGLLTGDRIVDGDCIIGFPSNGLHTNGYSLARKVFEERDWNERIDDITLGELLLMPHISYLEEVIWLKTHTQLHGMAHITGGGLAGNLIRVMPEGLKAIIHKDAAPRPRIFDLIMSAGVEEKEMWNVFNMGFGYLAVLPFEDAKRAMDELQGCFIAGDIHKGERAVELI